MALFNQTCGHPLFALSQQFFDISMTQFKAGIEPYSILNDFRWQSVPLDNGVDPFIRQLRFIVSQIVNTTL